MSTFTCVSVAPPPIRPGSGPGSGNVLVYNGPGAGTRSVQSTIHSLRAALNASITVGTIDPATLVRGEWRGECRLLIIPGGADLPYCKYLNGAGTRIIRDYVESGGRYLGLCAGAYFACKRVEFELGTPLEVQGDRELAFYPGIALGSLYPGFRYESEEGAVAATIQYTDQSTGTGTSTPQKWKECKDYVNGGPTFINYDNSKPANYEVLATFSDHVNGSNGIPATAALACDVGLGRAILCASHPELATSWLQLPSGATRSDGILNSDAESAVTRMSDANLRLAQELEDGEEKRWGFWLALLKAAGLSDYLATEAFQNPYRWSRRQDVSFL